MLHPALHTAPVDRFGILQDHLPPEPHRVYILNAKHALGSTDIFVHIAPSTHAKLLGAVIVRLLTSYIVIHNRPEIMSQDEKNKLDTNGYVSLSKVLHALLLLSSSDCPLLCSGRIARLGHERWLN
jgi:hypothetical protein